MHGNPQRQSLADVQDLRREGGRWLKKRREHIGLTQLQLAQRVGATHYTFISFLETGRGRIPPHRYTDWAHALEVSERDFVREMLRYYDPITFRILFAPTTNPHQRPDHPLDR